MSSILEELTAMRLADAAATAEKRPLATVEKEISSMAPALGFAARLKQSGYNVIAELKRASPSAGLIREDFNPAVLAKELVNGGAACLSVLCEPHRFLGGEHYLRNVRGVCSVPLLYKDFVSTRYQVAAARAAGADAVLLIAGVLDDARLAELLGASEEYGIDALVETHTAEEIERALELGAFMIGINCRNLHDFSTDPHRIDSLITLIPDDRVRIAESGMNSAADLKRLAESGSDGFLIGTALMKAPSPANKLREILAEAEDE